MRRTWHDSAATLLTGLVVAGYALFLTVWEMSRRHHPVGHG
jgi:hypothetical protein